MEHLLDSKIKVIKQICTSRYQIATVEFPDGNFGVAYVHQGEARLSEKLRDYNTANLYFEVKLQDFEGQ